MRVPSRDFTGHYVRSANGRYILAWREGDHSASAPGGRAPERGRYLLIEYDTIVAEGRAERPNDGKVADNGVFILNDWLFYRAAREGVFLAFSRDGAPMIARQFEANLHTNGLSHDGRYAACQTCNAPGDDGSKLTIFDLVLGTEIGSCVPESGWARAYEFDPDQRVVRLRYEDAAFAYGLDGSFIDREAWIAAELAKGNIYLVQRLLHDAGDNPTPETLFMLLTALGRALQRSDEHPQTRALAFKLRGSCHDPLGRFADALADYDAALAINPKVGVKKRAGQLRKDVGG